MGYATLCPGIKSLPAFPIDENSSAVLSPHHLTHGSQKQLHVAKKLDRFPTPRQRSISLEVGVPYAAHQLSDG
jgi:hypothetical protein